MSDIFFTNTDEIPLPPDEVRIRELAATPRPDGGRIKVHFALTPFQRRPNIEASIRNEEGREVSALSIVEAIDASMDFTMHLREAITGGRYTLELLVFYADVEAQAANGSQADYSQRSAGEVLEKARQIVDRRQVEFEIPNAGLGS
ncbi:MAG: hypothetical protein WD751_03675 [Anaerolineales bacterium]